MVNAKLSLDRLPVRSTQQSLGGNPAEDKLRIKDLTTWEGNEPPQKVKDEKNG